MNQKSIDFSQENNGKLMEIPMKKTNWKSIYLMTLFVFLDGTQYSMFFVSLWPYLNTVDPTTSATFFGIITACFSFGQGISAPIFGFWMNKAKTIKPALTFAFMLMIVSNAVYACTEFFPQDKRRYVMLAARFLIGFGAGDMAIMRAYSATASNIKDRARAVSLVTSAWVFGLAIGPGLQVVFEPIGYPGFKLFGLFHFDMYTAPAWFSSILDLISFILLWTVFKEEYAGIMTEEEKKQNPDIVVPKPKMLPICICIFTRFFVSFIVTNAETVGSMFCMAMFNWTNTQAVKYFGLIQLGQAVVNVCVSLSFAWKLGDFVNNRNKERITTIIGLCIGLSYHLLTFPWPFLPEKISGHVVYSNTSTEVVGCYGQEYSWCSYTHQVPLLAYVLGNLFLQSVAFPVALTPLTILYSKILGPVRQGTMTGILFMSGSVARTIGPIIVSTVFEHYGPEGTWGIQIGVLATTIVTWIIFYTKVKPFDLKSNLKNGEFLKYKNGIKTKF